MKLNIALVGNPNCGKTTLFNRLTGNNAHVGNWPGVTVAKKEGKYKKSKEDITIVDLPGIYSLSPYSPEEIVARNYLIDDMPDVVINIVDATNIERNLYLTTQLLEINCPMVIALNMIDVVEKQGDKIDIKALSKKFCVPVIPISASKNKGIDNLIEKAIEASLAKRKAETVLSEFDISKHIFEAEKSLNTSNNLYYAIKLIEKDEEAAKKFKEFKLSEDLGDTEAIIADLRYVYITKHLSSLYTKAKSQDELSQSAKIDKILTHKLLGIPIFLFMMFMIFHFTFSENFLFVKDLPSPGIFLQSIVEDGIESLSVIMESLYEKSSLPIWLGGLLIRGVFSGLGAVLSFLPQILVLFFFLSLLEDSGYMARAAFVMDRALRTIGLSGKSFVPMLMGFGCSVPAIMATRTIEKEKDRVMTMMLIPFMSCGAKLPIYAMMASVFFPNNTDTIVFGLYVFGVLLAIICGFFLKKTLFKGEDADFLMELVPYRMPSAKATFLHLFEKAKHFILKAGTVLLASVIVIWFLSNFDLKLNMLEEANSAKSILASLASLLTPIFRPLGFAYGEHGFKTVAAIFTGFLAKEAVVSTLGQLYASEMPLSVALASSINAAAALSFMVFNLITVPCVAATSTLRKEIGKKKYFIITIVFQLTVSWFAAFLVYNIAKLVLK